MGSSSSFDDYSSPAAGNRVAEMCMEIGGGRGRRRSTADVGGKTNTKQNKQPQRGLGVAQLEKIRLHNQMLAAYRSAAAQQQQMHDHHHHHQGHDVDAAAASATMIPAAGPSFHHLTNRCFEEEPDHDHRGVVVHYYDGLLPYSSRTATTPSLYAHDVRDSSGHRLGQPPQDHQQQQHYSWMMSSRSDGVSAEELDLELRL